MTSTTITMKASATTGTHRARYQERLAGGTAVKLPRGWARAGAVGGRSCRERDGPLPWRQSSTTYGRVRPVYAARRPPAFVRRPTSGQAPAASMRVGSSSAVAIGERYATNAL